MSSVPHDIKLEDFNYDLPPERIANAPLENRSDSKLLVYQKGTIKHSVFKDLTSHLPADSQLVFNDTKVISARLHFQKETGALIEIFLLEPLTPTNEIARAMLVKGRCQWRCMIGNLKKWKEDVVLTKEIKNLSLKLEAHLIDKEKQLVEFTWNDEHEFVHLVEAAGKIPLPPYIKRDVTPEDTKRYQTVYSENDGAVAAPTAGLHFDNSVVSDLKRSSIKMDYLTLHVSAGTFQPVKVKNAVEHNMHSEQVVINKTTIENVLSSKKTIAVGTTSMRTLESLYWYGVKLLTSGDETFLIEKLYPYQFSELPSRENSLRSVLSYMEKRSLDSITGSTEIYILPGYQFQICQGLITNYHLPGSTLILLVSAFIGKYWRTVYQEALAKDYRFLSYGDSSLLLP